MSSVTTAVAQGVRDARAMNMPLRVRAAGTWLGAGRPVESRNTVLLGDDRDIVEYVPGDLTVTARAGTKLSEIAAATRAHGQWLPLDPWGGDDGTIGATLATATAGPHAHYAGLPRDVVLGMEFVTGTGQVVRSGGCVVKNVAGFDLTRLMVGSWGTLGIITEATLRLRALPDEVHSVAIAVDTDSGALNALARRLRALPFTPMASELVSAGFASRLGLGDAAVLAVSVGGNARAVRAQREMLRELGDSREIEQSVWTRLRAADAGAVSSWRWSKLPALFGDTWSAAVRATIALSSALLHGNPMRGVVRVVVPATDVAAPQLARIATAFDGTVALECLPPDAWSATEHRAASDPLSRAMRAKFDPDRVLNRGILGEVAA